MTGAALEIRNLHKSFGALAVTRDVSLTLEPGARHALIGPNGAGKTTLVNLITGLIRPSRGSVLLEGENITSLSQANRCRRGIARTFQINQLFRGLTVLENIYLAVGENRRACGRLWRNAEAEHAVVDEAMSFMRLLKLDDVALKHVRELPYGRQRLVEIAIAMALRPKVLLLDEPAAGVPSSESHLILDAVGALDPQVAILIIEHDMDVVFRFANRVTVLVAGAVLMQGSPREVVADERVRAVYLGAEAGQGEAQWPQPTSPSN